MNRRASLPPAVQVESIKPGEYRVRVIEAGGETTHIVSLQPGDYQRLAAGRITPDELLRRAFKFLLAREPKESILVRFDLPMIARYFPDFEEEIRRGL
jgi:hypothetical protein